MGSKFWSENNLPKCSHFLPRTHTHKKIISPAIVMVQYWIRADRMFAQIRSGYKTY